MTVMFDELGRARDRLTRGGDRRLNSSHHDTTQDVPPLAGAAVLVVEDEPVLRRVVARMLADAGAQVREAADGDQAIAIAAAQPVDLLLTDMDLPGRDGAAVAVAVATIRPQVAVVFMSGRPHEIHLANGRLAAKDRLVEKPFGSRMLVATLAAALASTREAAAQGRDTVP